MKKFSKILAVFFVVVFTALAMVACAPNKNPDKALQSLKANGYEAGMVTKATQTDPAFELTFNEIAKAIGITTAATNSLVAVVSGVKAGESETESETVTILYFDSKDSMKKCWRNRKIYIEKDTESDLIVERSGKIIYIGTKAAINAARG